MSTRSEREIEASDQSNIYDNQTAMRRRLRHVFKSPNTLHCERMFDEIARSAAAGKRVLEIACGFGEYARELHTFGARYVRAVDISRKEIAYAKSREVPGQLEYAVEDVALPFDGAYDVIVGRAALHHFDYQELLQRLYTENLAPGGTMLFYEPLGTNWLIKAYHSLAKGMHTEDERPFDQRDLHWMRRRFVGFTFLPVNYLSLPLGVVSSFVFRSPDNWLLRAADRVDRWLTRRIPALRPRFRYAVFVIRKPAGGEQFVGHAIERGGNLGNATESM